MGLVWRIQIDDDRSTLREAKRGFKRFGQPFRGRRAGFEAIDHHINRMPAISREGGDRIELMQSRASRTLRSHPDAGEPLRTQRFEQFEVFAFALRDDRGQDHESSARRACHDGIHHL